MDLESSTAALRAFSQKYVDPEHQEEFNSLIDDFHQYNAEYLKTYHAFGEELELRAAQMNGDGTIDRWLAQGGALFNTSDEMSCPNEIPDVSHTEDEANAYWGNLAQIFEMMHIVFKSRKDNEIINKCIHSVLGIDMEGQKNILGIWISENESASFYASICSDLKKRGVMDMFIICAIQICAD